ncbi:MAG: hypothetical protein ACRELB_12890 [Polyangiaceae bacterium]
MQPYVIKQGDYLAQLAHRFDFDADTVWNDDKNADLRKSRPDPNMLWPSDVLYIPDQVDKEPKTISLDTGATNTFVADAPTVTITIKFVDDDYASKPCTVQELPQLTGASTDAGGVLKFDVPVTLGVATVQFEDPACTCYCEIGGLDPAATLSGIFQRLQNLVYYADDETVDTSGDLATVRGAVRAFKAPAPGGGPPAGTDSGDGSQDDAGPASSQDDSTGTDITGDAGSGDSADADDPSNGSSGAASSEGDPAANSNADDAGLGDDGTMDDDLSQLLLTAHGC